MTITHNLYRVLHLSFQTGHWLECYDLCPTSSLVEAKTKQGALRKYNALAKLRHEYPYCWNQVKLSSVYEITDEEIIR